jgi:hypothetical protein
MYFKVTEFNGIAPVVAPRLLADGVAQTAENVVLNSGRAVPLRTNSQVTAGFSSGVTVLSNAARTSIWRYTPESTDYWLQWDEDVDVVDGPLPKDSYDRVYLTGETYPRVGSEASMISGATYPAATYKLGVPALTLHSTITSPVDSGFTGGNRAHATDTPVAGAFPSNLDSETPNSVAYVFTYVTGFGEEGPPSAATSVIQVTDNATVNSSEANQTVSMPVPQAPSSPGTFTTGHKWRLYRSNTGSQTTAFQFVTESTTFGASDGSVKVIDALDGDELGEVIPSTYWISPPDNDSNTYPEGPMLGLTAMPNGVFAGFAGRRLCFSEPYLPHAWPVSYRITTEDRIVAIAMAGNVLLVATEGNPYIVGGTDPSAMTAVRLEAAHACVNKRSMVDMGDYAMYASPDGLIAVAGNQVQNVTESLIDPKDWLATYAPTTIQGFLHEGTYVGFYSTGTNSRGGFLFDPRRGKNAFTTLTLTSTTDPRGGYYDPEDGQLYLIDTTATNRKIQKFQGSATLSTLKWKSKKFVTPKPVSMSWVSVSAEAYPFTVSVWADGTLIYVGTVTESGGTKTLAVTTPSGINDSTIVDTVMRLPSSIAKEWEVQIESTKNINSLCLAESIDELRAV